MFDSVTIPVPIGNVPAAVSGAPYDVILIGDEPQLPVLIRAVLQAAGVEVNLFSALPAMVYEFRAGSSSPSAAILDLPFRIDENEISEGIAALRSVFPGIRVLLMTGCAADENLSLRLPHRDVWFLLKPFSISTLTGTVREILNGNGGRPGVCAAGNKPLRRQRGKIRTSSDAFMNW